MSEEVESNNYCKWNLNLQSCLPIAAREMSNLLDSDFHDSSEMIVFVPDDEPALKCKHTIQIVFSGLFEALKSEGKYVGVKVSVSTKLALVPSSSTRHGVIVVFETGPEYTGFG